MKGNSVSYTNKCPTRCNYTPFILTVNCSTCFEWFLHPSSGAQITASIASSISQPLLLPVAIVEEMRHKKKVFQSHSRNPELEYDANFISYTYKWVSGNMCSTPLLPSLYSSTTYLFPATVESWFDSVQRIEPFAQTSSNAHISCISVRTEGCLSEVKWPELSLRCVEICLHPP